jgi:hypothetical protein
MIGKLTRFSEEAELFSVTFFLVVQELLQLVEFMLHQDDVAPVLNVSSKLVGVLSILSAPAVPKLILLDEVYLSQLLWLVGWAAVLESDPPPQLV